MEVDAGGLERGVGDGARGAVQQVVVFLRLDAHLHVFAPKLTVLYHGHWPVNLRIVRHAGPSGWKGVIQSSRDETEEVEAVNHSYTRWLASPYPLDDRLRIGWLNGLGGVPREQKMLKGHLPRVIYHQVY